MRFNSKQRRVYPGHFASRLEHLQNNLKSSKSKASSNPSGSGRVLFISPEDLYHCRGHPFYFSWRMNVSNVRFSNMAWQRRVGEQGISRSHMALQVGSSFANVSVCLHFCTFWPTLLGGFAPPLLIILFALRLPLGIGLEKRSMHRACHQRKASRGAFRW